MSQHQKAHQQLCLQVWYMKICNSIKEMERVNGKEKVIGDRMISKRLFLYNKTHLKYL